MTSHPHPHSTTMPLPAIHDEDTEEESSSQSSASSTTSPQFAHFTALPPELRHHIWRLAIPSPGINFFNVHCFPNDHAGCSRSTSPPWAYLDLRRLTIEDSDADVSRYDPSAWQARLAVRQSCREARDLCTVPASKSAIITLTRPRRGLFVRAGDGQLRKTPLRAPVVSSTAAADNNNDITNKSAGGRVIEPEPVVRRTIEVHVDDVLCLSVENCSFNLPHEETPSFPDEEDDDDNDGGVDGLATTGDADEGWAYDPQLTPRLPAQIPAGRVCASLTRCSMAPLRITTDALFGLLYSHIPGYLELRPGELWPGRLLLMFDAVTQAVGERDPEELTPTPEVVWDRFGDCYVRVPWRTGDFHPPDGFPIMYRLTKVWPETNDIRDRYLRSALLHSSKRPARPVNSYVPTVEATR
ncbi:hypothetical protein F4782DRAFT_451460 [Xylaria castorea]|nr:hypothetical protein F4782DRAFT_451460 [Xylaria castorea]